MKIDRCYILLGQFNRHSQSVDGSDFYEIDLREIMGGLYDKYNRFNIKLEAYHSRAVNSSALPSETQFLQIGGFNWLSGYDTNVAFSHTRTANMMYFQHLAGQDEYQRTIVYPSNIGTMTFSKQASPRILMELFTTDPDLTTKVNPLFGGENPNFLFSITGVEDRYNIVRQPEIIEKTGRLVLNASDAVDLEPSKRAIRWSVDLSQLIDSETYSKYSKFALITKMIQQNNVPANFSAWLAITFLMSGLNWYSPSLKLNRTYQGSTSFLNLYHQGAPTVIAITDTSNPDTIKETFIDNVFYKPASPIVDLSLTFNRQYTLDLLGVTAPIDPFLFIFDIVPVDDE